MQHIMPGPAVTGRRADYYKGMALELYQQEEHRELRRLALCLGQRNRRKGDQELIPAIERIVDLLSQHLEGIPAQRVVDFYDGSLEIGWLYQTLRMYGFTGALAFPHEDFHQFLYRRLIFERSSDMSVAKGVLGKAIYLLSCYEDSVRTRCEDQMKLIEQRECLVYLVEDIHAYLYTDDLYNSTVALFNGDNEILHLLLFLSRVIDLKLYPEVARQMIKDVLPCVAHWMCGDSENAGDPPVDLSEGSRFRSSFESWEFMEFLQAMPAKYRIPDHFIGLPAFCSKDRLCERLVSRLSPGTFVNYMHHEAIQLSGIVRLVTHPLIH